MYVCVCVCVRARTYIYIYIHTYIYIYVRGEFNKFPDIFVQVFKNCRRLLKIQYVIAIYLMR